MDIRYKNTPLIVRSARTLYGDRAISVRVPHQQGYPIIDHENSGSNLIAALPLTKHGCLYGIKGHKEYRIIHITEREVPAMARYNMKGKHPTLEAVRFMDGKWEDHHKAHPDLWFYFEPSEFSFDELREGAIRDGGRWEDDSTVFIPKVPVRFWTES